MGDHTLRIPGLLRKTVVEQCLQLVAIELSNVKRIRNVAAFIVHRPVRRRYDEYAVCRQYTAEFGEHFTLRSQMLDRLERYDDIDAR